MNMKRLLSALLCIAVLMASVTVLADTNEATPGEATRCDHANGAVKTEERNVIYAKDAQTHTKSYDLVTVHTCPDCEAGNYEEDPVSKTDAAEAHTFVDGVCSVCDYEMIPEPTATPTAEPTAEPTATPAPAPQPAGNTGSNNSSSSSRPSRPKATAVPTAEPTAEPVTESVAESVAAPMVSALLSTITAVETEGTEVTIEVVGAQEIMTETEYTALKALPVQEQILVTLASIGLDGVAEAATAALNVELSEDAQALVAQVTERMAAVPEEERAAVEEKLAQYFPVEEIEVDGVATSYFVIDLKIEVDGAERVERYGFRLDENGEWIFEKLDLPVEG